MPQLMARTSQLPSFLVLGTVTAYIAYYALLIAGLYNPLLNIPYIRPIPVLKYPRSTLSPKYGPDTPLRVEVYLSRRKDQTRILEDNSTTLVYKEFWTLDSRSTIDVDLNVSITSIEPMYAHAFVLSGHETASEESPHAATNLLKPMDVQIDDTTRLFSDDKPEQVQEATMPHWQSKIVLHIVNDQRTYPYEILQSMTDVVSWMRFTKERSYLPIVYMHDDAVERSRHEVVHTTPTEVPLHLSISAISLGSFRVKRYVSNMFAVLRSGQAMQMGEKEIESLRYTFFIVDPALLALTLIASALHLAFEALALKNDVAHWKRQDHLAGVASSSVYMGAFSSVMSWLYLWDKKEETSSVVVYGAMAATAVELWKAIKVYRMPKTTSVEKKSVSQANKYLLYACIPISIGYAGYSILFRKFSSFKSYGIDVGVFIVYLVEFVQLTPQLFLNYTLKSTAAMPVRTFIFRFLNTIIDDLFAFTIKMPMLARIAVFRDDIVFVILLWQMWIYKQRSDGDDEKKRQ